MKNNYDQPKYVNKTDNDDTQAVTLIKELCTEQSFGALATQEDQACHSSLISFAASKDFSQLAFATPVDTKKLDFIKGNESVSVLIDNRSNNPKSINDIVAVTVMGKAAVLTEKEMIEKWSKILEEKHSYLADFIKAPTTAIVLIDVSKYFFVSNFQAVVEWLPDEKS